MDEVGLQQGKD